MLNTADNFRTFNVSETQEKNLLSRITPNMQPIMQIIGEISRNEVLTDVITNSRLSSLLLLDTMLESVAKTPLVIIGDTNAILTRLVSARTSTNKITHILENAADVESLSTSCADLTNVFFVHKKLNTSLSASPNTIFVNTEWSHRDETVKWLRTLPRGSSVITQTSTTADDSINSFFDLIETFLDVLTVSDIHSLNCTSGTIYTTCGSVK